MKPPFLKYRHWLQYNLLFLIEHVMGADFFDHPGSAKDKLTDAVYDDLRKKNIQTDISPEALTHSEVIKNLTHPLFYKGLAKSWPAYKKWTPDYFKEAYGDRDVVINNSKGIVDPNAPQVMEIIKLKSYIEELEQGSRKYLKLSDLARKEKSLQEDLDLNWLKKFKKAFSFGETFYMFIGGKDTVTPMHNEFTTTLYIQLYGKKKWIVYPPEDRIFLDAVTERRPYFFSNYIPNTINKEYKLGSFARKQEILMEPGDVLVVPPFFWHYVENQTDSIGVAYKFADIFSSFRSSKMFTILTFLATRPFLLYSFFAGRIKKEDLILSNK